MYNLSDQINSNKGTNPFCWLQLVQLLKHIIQTANHSKHNMWSLDR